MTQKRTRESILFEAKLKNDGLSLDRALVGFRNENPPTSEAVATHVFVERFGKHVLETGLRINRAIDQNPTIAKLSLPEGLAVEAGILSVEEVKTVREFFEQQITNVMLDTVTHRQTAGEALSGLISLAVEYGIWVEAERQKHIAGTQPVTSPFATGDGIGDENGPAHIHNEETEDDAMKTLLAAFVGKEEAARIREVATGKKSNYEGAERASVQSFAGPGDGTGNATDVSEPGTGNEELPTTDTVNDPTPNDSDPCTGAPVMEQASKTSEAISELKTDDPCIGF